MTSKLTSNWSRLDQPIIDLDLKLLKELIQVILILQLIRQVDIRDGLVKILNCLMGTHFLFHSSRTNRTKHVQSLNFKRVFYAAILVKASPAGLGCRERSNTSQKSSISTDIELRNRFRLVQMKGLVLAVF